ncbi:hypothetical protein O3G_MSEX011552 [Manduca sexta]|uniref:Uncharacterized protein n=1 Tax=Manduca sexta TaxID=7130 RepID=A0A921ZL16_MANSE|nr:hypothetical protein O3G_MSEX011552 [Manduca sexta]
MIADDEEAVKKKIDKTCSDNLTVSLDTTCDVKKSEKGDAEDPKPRIVLTIRSEKSSAKSNNMKIVSTEEKLEEVSPRRSSRTRGKWEWVCDSDTSASPKKYKSASENDDSDAHNAKRSTSRRSKDTDNVVANAIARKEKLYEDITPQRSTRRQKPKGPEETADKLGDRVKTRRSARPTATETQKSKAKEDIEMDIVDSDDEVLDRGNRSQLRHLSELGLKAVTIEDDEEVEESGELEENEAEELEDDGDLDEEAEAIGKLLDEEEDSPSDGDEDFYCSAAASPSEQPRRSKRLCSSFTNDSDCSSPAREDEQK